MNKKKLIKKSVSFAILIILGLATILLIRTEFFIKKSSSQKVPTLKLELPNSEEITQRLRSAIQFKTISHQDETQNDWEEFRKFINYLPNAFPAVHTQLTREIVNEFSLLYIWQGTDPKLSPALFIAHYDVVPVEEGTESLWTYPPFEGAIAEGFIWGRGTLDVKCNVMGILEAVEYLLKQNYRPKRTILIAFGHDEEVGGRQGARKIAELLKTRNIYPEFSLDEGMSITQGMIPGIQGLVGLIGIAEKGYLSLELTVTTQGGHSSNPPQSTSIGILARAIHTLEQNPMPATIAGPIYWMLNDLAPYMSFPMRLICSNLWLFSPVLKYAFTHIPSANAGIRTTFAPTLFHAGEKENVLPTTAKAVVNIRMLPGDSKKEVIQYIRNIISNPRIEISEFSPEKTDEASPISDINSLGYKIVTQSIKEIWGNIPIAPALTLGGTDSINYIDIVKNTFRFQPLIFTQEDLNLLHGTNERIKINDYLNAIRFYIQMLKNTGEK